MSFNIWTLPWGRHVFCWRTFCIHFSLPSLQTESTGKEGTGGALRVILLHGYREEQFTILIFSGFWEARGNSPAPRSGEFEAGDSLEPFLDESHLLWFPHLLHLTVLPPSLKIASWALPCCPYSFGLGHRSLPGENVHGLHMLAWTRFSPETQKEAYIARVI